ncbi:MAG TPA: 16S rRNA (uracil(1498)-N(3))-methyltransferase [Rickettsia endosymbiont of Pyrocoelia pectoralis]|nr:16S rRNA (uracil(1498)-N(3))-methyltransferase [Rickettsia endosymbiont of Pyrocoelia pectoralis]
MKYNRIYINSRLAENSKLELYDDHAHYIKTVLRLRVNDKFRVFNDQDGEFIAQISDFGKNNISANIKECLRNSYLESPLTLAISIIKQDKLMLAVNMATQLGVTRIIPVITERCQFRAVNTDRLKKCAIEATEQSERLTTPVIEEAMLLQDYLKRSNDFILYANEHEKEENSIYSSALKNCFCKTSGNSHAHLLSIGCACSPLVLHSNSPNHLSTPQVLASFKGEKSNVSVLIGPEGGFTNAEIEMLRSHKNTQSIGLGKNILRAETAAVSAIAQVKLFVR